MAMADAWDGVPLNPERDGWHWLGRGGSKPEPFDWSQAYGEWWFGGSVDFGGEWKAPDYVRLNYRYLGPCLTPDEVAAREAAAAEAMRKKASEHCARIAAFMPLPDATSGARACAGVVERLPLPAADALARALDAARAEEREACAQEADCGCAARADVLARLATDGEKRASYLCVHGDVCCALQADAIRARGKEAGGE